MSTTIVSIPFTPPSPSSQGSTGGGTGVGSAGVWVFFALAIALALLIGGLACLHNRARRRRAALIANEAGTQVAYLRSLVRCVHLHSQPAITPLLLSISATQERNYQEEVEQ